MNTDIVERSGESVVRRSATLSVCRRYRYTLTRLWDQGRPLIVFVGLNPSTADGRRDDPTVRRCVGFARDWGYGALVLVNLFALRSTDPARLRRARDPIGPENDDWISRLVQAATMIVAAWGAHGDLRGRDRRVLELLPTVFCLGRTRDGHPRHPLYLARETELEPF